MWRIWRCCGGWLDSCRVTWFTKLRGMTRRDFVKTAAVATAGFAAGPLNGAESGTTASEKKLILSAPLTHSDWMLKPGIAWDAEGVRHMLDACKACGWSRV